MMRNRHRCFRRLAAALCAGVLCLCLPGCGRKYVELDNAPVLNYTAPEPGEEIVTLYVRDRGDIKIKLFPDLLPEACENFTTLAEQGYYDELIFHRVIENFMIQGGDPKGDGTGGESCWGGDFDGGYSRNLIHLPGALAYANSAGTATDNSQFYIVTGQTVSDDMLDELMEEQGIYYTPEARQLYLQYGGAPWLDGGNYTVFGQVIDGLDVVYDIAAAEVNPTNDKPKKAIYIDHVTVEQYDGSEIRFYPADYAVE